MTKGKKMLYKNCIRLISNALFSLSESRIVPATIRVEILRLIGVRLGIGTKISHNVFIGGKENLFIGSNCFINCFSFIDNSGEVFIEDFVRIGPHVKILTGTHSYINSKNRRGKGSSDINLKVVVGYGSWIGMGVILMPGVVVAEGCVVAAGSVVTKSTEPNGLYAGVPAKRVKDLSTELDT